MTSGQADVFEPKWADPGDAEYSWTFDPMHFPHPLPPLAQDLFARVTEAAFDGRTMFLNGYAFVKDPMPPPPTREIMERGAVQVWEGDSVPRISAFCAEIRTRDYDALATPELVEALADVVDRAGKTFRYTMEVVYPFMGPGLALMEYSEQVLGPDGPGLAAAMLQGASNATADAGSAMAALAESAAQVPGLVDALGSGRLETVAAVPGSAGWLVQFNAFLADYGWRLDDWTLLQMPTWAEEPDRALPVIYESARNSERSPAAGLQRAATARDEAMREVESRISGPQLEQFRGMVQAAQAHVPMSEGRARWQLTIVGSTRVPLMAVGRRLVATGALADPNDVLYLSLAELRQAAADPAREWRETAASRKADLERWETLAPPPFVGTPPDMHAMPPEGMAVMRRFFGFGVAPSAEAGVVTGNAASRGVVRGRAKIIRGLEDAHRLEKGDILVCVTTSPPWTSLFGLAAAVVADTGGVLSHSAICAREYGIPCVVGTQNGTSRIRDGAIITVDGTKGTVQIEG